MMNKLWKTIVYSLPVYLVLAGVEPSTATAAPTVISREVIQAIKRGADRLLRLQRSGQMWESSKFGATGSFNNCSAQSALATESLLYVGQSLHLPELNLFSPKMRVANGRNLGQTIPRTPLHGIQPDVFFHAVIRDG